MSSVAVPESSVHTVWNAASVASANPVTPVALEDAVAVNTLALSVHERTRELGLLRAVGMTRSQVRQMVRWESVVISLIGAASGAVLGTGLGLVLAQALKDEGIKSVSVPWLSISLYVAAAAVAGVVAAVGPGRSASRVDVLKAVVTD